MEQAISDQVIGALNANNAAIFGRLLARSNDIIDLLDQGAIGFIIAPNDAAFNQFFQTSSMTLEQFIGAAVGRAVMKNHFGGPVSNTAAQALMISGNQIPLDKASIGSLSVQKAVVVGSIRIIVVAVVLATATQRTSALAVRDAGPMQSLTYYGFRSVVNNGQLKGRDLIGFCLSNTAINDFCNRANRDGETLFHNLLFKEFNYVVPQRHHHRARQLYIEFHSIKMAVIHPAGALNCPGQIGFAVNLAMLDEPYISVQAIYIGLPAERIYVGLTVYGAIFSFELDQHATINNKQQIGDPLAHYSKVVFVKQNVFYVLDIDGAAHMLMLKRTESSILLKLSINNAIKAIDIGSSFDSSQTSFLMQRPDGQRFITENPVSNLILNTDGRWPSQILDGDGSYIATEPDGQIRVNFILERTLVGQVLLGSQNFGKKTLVTQRMANRFRNYGTSAAVQLSVNDNLKIGIITFDVGRAPETTPMRNLREAVIDFALVPINNKISITVLTNTGVMVHYLYPTNGNQADIVQNILFMAPKGYKLKSAVPAESIKGTAAAKFGDIGLRIEKLD